MLKNLFRLLFFSSWKRTFSVLGILIIAISLPLTLITVQHQQDLRQRADYGGVTFSANQTVSGADRTQMPTIGGDAQTTFQLMEAAGLDGQPAVSTKVLVTSLLAAQTSALGTVIRGLDTIRQVPYATIISAQGRYFVYDISGNDMSHIGTAFSLDEAEKIAQSVKVQMPPSSSDIPPLTDAQLSYLNKTFPNNPLNAEKSIQNAATYLDANSSTIQNTMTNGSNGIDSLIHHYTITNDVSGVQSVEVHLVDGTTETFSSWEEYLGWAENLKSSLNAFEGTPIATGADILSAEPLASAVTESDTLLLSALKGLGRISAVTTLLSIAFAPSGYSIYWDCSPTDPHKPERIVVNDTLGTLKLESARCETGTVCKVTSNTDITCVPEGPTSTPTPTQNSDPTCASLGQNAYCNQFQCSGTDVAFSQNTRDCSDNSASAGVPLLCCAPVQNSPALPDCAGKYGSGFSCQDALSDGCMPPNEVKDSSGTTCNTNFSSGGVYACCAAPNTPVTLKSTAPPTRYVPPPIIPTPVAPYPCNQATSSCDSQNSASVTFNWTQQESNVDYEVAWDGSGGSHDAGTNVSSYTYHGFSPNQTFSYQITPIRSGASGVVCSNSITIGSCTTTPTCASEGYPSKCVSPSFSSGVEPCTTSDNQPGYYNYVQDPPEGHFSDCSTGVNDQCAVCQASANSPTKIATKAQATLPPIPPSSPSIIPIGQPCTKGSTNCQTGSTCTLVDKGLGAPASYFCYPDNSQQANSAVGQPCGAYSSNNAGCPNGLACVAGDCEPPGTQLNNIGVFSNPNTYCANNNCGQSTQTNPRDTIKGSVIIQDSNYNSSCILKIGSFCLGGSSTHRLKGATITIDSNITVTTDSFGGFEKSVPHADTHTVTLSVPEDYQLVSPESSTQTFQTTGTTWKQDLRNVNFTVGKSLISPTAQLTQSPPICDPNGDGKVDSVDMTILENEWFGTLTTKTADCNKDGVVNGVDFQILKDEINGLR